MSATDIRTRLTEVSALVCMARSLLADGNPVDLSNLEVRVEGLCRSLIVLPRDDREEIKPNLVALMDELGRLAETVRAQHAALAERLSTVVRGQRAVGAYGAPVGMPRRPKR
jgi:hypothetical protein